MASRSEAGVELGLAPRPILVALTVAEHMLLRRTIDRGPPGQSFHDRQRRLRQRDEVLASILGARRRQRNERQSGRDLVPGEAADLVAARPGQYQQLDDGTELIIVQGSPDDQ